MTIDITARNFFRLLRAGTFNQEEEIEPISAWKWKRIYQFSLMHGVSALTYDGLQRCSSQFFVQPPESLTWEWEKSTQEIAQKNLRWQELTAMLLDQFNHLQLRPILLGGQCLAQHYDQPEHRQPEGACIFFPFETQGRKADEWARANGKDTASPERYILSYAWNGMHVEHRHHALQLTNKMLSHSLQNIVEKDIRENPPTFIAINDIRIEVPSPTLSLLLLLLSIAQSMLSEGILLKQLTDLGIFLRKVGDKVDYVKFQDWMSRIGLNRMGQLAGVLLVELLGFTPDEVPFMSAQKQTDISQVLQELFLMRRPKKSEWFVQQSGDIFVHAINTQAMFWQVQHSARYFRYYPSESFTNLFSSFAHSLSHIEE